MMQLFGEFILEIVFEVISWALHGVWVERRDRVREKRRARAADRRARAEICRRDVGRGGLRRRDTGLRDK
jgi:hypothetical protein